MRTHFRRGVETQGANLQCAFLVLALLAAVASMVREGCGKAHGGDCRNGGCARICGGRDWSRWLRIAGAIVARVRTSPLVRRGGRSAVVARRWCCVMVRDSGCFRSRRRLRDGGRWWLPALQVGARRDLMEEDGDVARSNWLIW